MERRNERAKEQCGDEYEESGLGSKLHKAFMAEVGAKMCQAEVTHHANRMPEYLISRPVKHVHMYKKALAISTRIAQQKTAVAEDNWWDGEWNAEMNNSVGARKGTRPSGLNLYKRRCNYRFWPDTTTLCDHLPYKDTPEEQVLAASAQVFLSIRSFPKRQATSVAAVRHFEFAHRCHVAIDELDGGPRLCFWCLLDFDAASCLHGQK